MPAKRHVLQRLQRAGPLTWLLAAVCGWALLLWLATLLGMGTHLRQLPLADAVPLPTAKPRSADRVGPLSTYSEAAERPLFTEDRRPQAFIASIGEGEDGSAAATLDFALTGVLLSPQVRLAILQPSGGGEPQRVREGAAVEGAAGWRLLELQPRRAIFEGGGGRVTLELRSYGVPVNGEPSRGSYGGEQPFMPTDDPPPPPPPPPSREQAVRVDEIRRRIEARRAELRSASAPPPPHAGNTPSRANLQPVKTD